MWIRWPAPHKGRGAVFEDGQLVLTSFPLFFLFHTFYTLFLPLEFKKRKLPLNPLISLDIKVISLMSAYPQHHDKQIQQSDPVIHPTVTLQPTLTIFHNFSASRSDQKSRQNGDPRYRPSISLSYTRTHPTRRFRNAPHRLDLHSGSHL